MIISQGQGLTTADLIAYSLKKIFALNLKERGDKLEAITLAASLTGITLDILNAVRGEQVSNKLLPWHDVCI